MRVGIIGCGYQGDVHLQAFAAMDGVEVVGLCDLDRARLDALGDRFGVHGRHTDYRELLAEDLDLVTICTMPNTHHAMALDAFAAGAHVLCEKPLAMSAAQVAEMERAAARAGRVLAGGFNMRYMDGAIAVRDFVAEGTLGAPICARAFMLAEDVPWWGRHYVRELSGGGVLASTAVHVIDLVTWLVGGPAPVTATASMTTVFPRKRLAGAPDEIARTRFDAEDLLFGHVRFDDGFWLSLEATWVYDAPAPQYGFDLLGTAGQAHFDPLALRAERDGEVVDLTGGRTTNADWAGSTRRLLFELVDDLRAGREPRVTGPQGLRVQALIDALYRSAAEGREVEVALPAVAGSVA